MYQNILVSEENQIATLTLNRPQYGNAFAVESYGEIVDAMEAFGKDENIRAVVITGAGKFFSTGGDVVSFRKLIDDKIYIPKEGAQMAGDMAIAVRKCPKPVIAMVNGAAAGAGLGLALACDFRVVDEKSTFLCAFSNLGLPGDTLTQYMLVKLAGMGKTQYMMTSGKPVTGEALVEMGLADKLAAPGQLSEAAYKLAKFYAGRPPKSFARQKEYYNTFVYDRIDEVADFEGEGMYACSRSADFDEAVNAFLQKRPPVFTGK